jgi:hypothetical protein
MGSARLEPVGSFTAGSMESFTLVYTAGRFGVDDTGSVKIGFRFATDFGPVQFSDPSGPGYTTAEASNGATLELKWEFKRNIRPWSRSLYIGVVKDFLAPGDTITIRFGDRRKGSPGIRLQTYCERDFEFRVFADPVATYDYVALPDSPRISIVPGSGVRWRAVLPTLVRAGSPFRLGVKVEDSWGNPSDVGERRMRLEPSRPVNGLPDVLTMLPGAFSSLAEGLSAPAGDDIVIQCRDMSGTIVATTNPLRIAQPDQQLLHYWGDTHGQSDETLGTNSARDYFLFGRDRAFLDVMGHQGNDFQITGAFWRDLNRLTAQFDAAGSFVCIPGYEWSANTAAGGDRNVHFRTEGETIHRSSHAQITDADDMRDEASDAHDARELFAKLAGRDCVVAAHVGGRYADIAFAHDGRLESAVEVHSAWGTFEWIVKDAFELNYRVGIVANSDGHKGRPGACYPGASFFGSYGGLTCFIAQRLDRDAIFESMRRRRHYATTGNRAYLAVEVRAASDMDVFARDPAHGETGVARSPIAIMGDIARTSDDEVALAIDVHGSAPIERVDIFDGLELIETFRPYGDTDLGRGVRFVYTGAEYRGRARTTTWDGRVRLEGPHLAAARVFNNWNLDRGIVRQDERGLDFKAVTTGNYGGIDLDLAALAGSLSFETGPVSGRVDLERVGVAPIRFDAGGLERAVELQRLPAIPPSAHLRLERRVPVRGTGDTRLYVRVQQMDGHRIWSSPVYLFRK